MNRKPKRCKVRKMTFLEGQNGHVMTDLPKIDGKEFIKFFSEIISSHPECTFNRSWRKRFNKSLEAVSASDNKVQNPLKSELVFGANQVIKKIHEDHFIGVVVSDPLTIHLQATLFDLCKNYDVPVLLCGQFNKITQILSLTRLSCFGFKKIVEETSSLCHPLYKIFMKNAHTSDHSNSESPCHKKHLIETEKSETTIEVHKDIEDEFEIPPVENFHIPIEENIAVNKCGVNSSEEPFPCRKMDDFINLNTVNNFFPVRPFFCDPNLEIRWTNEEEDNKKVTSLVKKLFTPDELKHTFSQPKTIQLPSSGRSRDKRGKKMKKLN